MQRSMFRLTVGAGAGGWSVAGCRETTSDSELPSSLRLVQRRYIVSTIL